MAIHFWIYDLAISETLNFRGDVWTSFKGFTKTECIDEAWETWQSRLHRSNTSSVSLNLQSSGLVWPLGRLASAGCTRLSTYYNFLPAACHPIDLRFCNWHLVRKQWATMPWCWEDTSWNRDGVSQSRGLRVRDDRVRQQQRPVHTL